MAKTEIQPLRMDNIHDELICCVGKRIFNDPPPQFAKGIEYKHAWLRGMIKKYGEAGRIAYKNAEPVGFLEFVPGKIAPIVSPDKDLCVYVDCYYVLQDEQSRGIGSALVNSTVEEFSQGHPWFEGEPAESIKLIAYEESEWKGAEPFYKVGFQAEMRWIYSDTESERIPVLMTFDIKPKKREPKEITVSLPAQERLPLSVKVFRSTPCPYGSPDFIDVQCVARRFGKKVKFEIFDMWEKPELVEVYGPNPGTVVNDQLVWASPDEYKATLENTIREQLQRIETKN